MKLNYELTTWSVELMERQKRRNKYIGLNILNGEYYELITRVGNLRYEVFIFHINHIYATVERYIEAVLTNNSGKYGARVSLANFSDLKTTDLPVEFFRVGGDK